MNLLDDFTSQYKPGAATAIENNLVLNWYPDRLSVPSTLSGAHCDRWFS